MKQPIETYIKNLLLNNHRVIVPDLGAFIARASSGSAQGGSLSGKTIVFNDILKFNDGLLVNHIMQEEDVDLNLALDDVSAFSANVLATLKEDKNFMIPGVGILSRDKRGNISLQQNVSEEIPSEFTINENPPATETESKEEILPPALEKNTIVDNIKDETIQVPVENKEPVLIENKEETKETVQVIDEPEALYIQPEDTDKKEIENTEETVSEAPVQMPPPIISDEEIKETPPEIYVESLPPVLEEKLPPIVISDDVIKVERTKEEVLPPPLPVEKKEPEKILAPERPSIELDEMRRIELVEMKKTEKKTEIKPKEEKIPVSENQPVKPVKKAKADDNAAKKKKSVLFPVIIWSASGMMFLALVFMAAVKFGFIKGVKIDLFSKNEWVSVNDKLSADLNDFNKKNRDKLMLPEGESKKQGDNVGFSDGESGGSEGGFDASADNSNSFGSGEEVKASENKTSEGSFDAPADKTPPVKEQKKEKEKPAEKEKAAPEPKLKKEEPQKQASSGGRIVLVAGSFKEQILAEKFATQLQTKGFENASYIGKVNGLHLVAYNTFDDQKMANAEYAKLQQKGVQTYLTKR
ncbi:MAG: hypothetical protein A2275_10000 [Bacteroidetes bacterium RIFOXYA12_FULL_35_11]|nr:MAG: hypothetical protein A2X01_09840 [Bacteroidetes bacterium GWF2_35_48]OFY83231.1 MAG: hypothetical protein A2275_10000 [Bacteroidetes bacterium RIFOXYA12_FULL_35_11]OFY92964.1 MAG: hypothetical protein A2491_04640 [Bacteroidetes bacterium RIFOXYC12_FULL_35_7]OFY94452.1 MAG: hypothetical protein A2309_08820 [Bacteroidetes bacterium RIFOXYB2_FULL_35_7]HBX51618.1 hypothetical protein [Bacteroidales bacterium]